MENDQQLTGLLAACALGDRRAFARLYDHTSPTVFAILLRTLKRRDWAEEALQDAFVRIWENATEYRPDKGRPLTWMIGIARYRAVDLYRRERRHVADPHSAEVLESLADEHAGEHSDEPVDAGRLDQCLERLEAAQRRCLLLAYCEGYSHQELSHKLAAPLGTIKTWIRRGLQRLKDCIEA